MNYVAAVLAVVTRDTWTRFSSRSTVSGTSCGSAWQRARHCGAEPRRQAGSQEVLPQAAHRPGICAARDQNLQTGQLCCRQARDSVRGGASTAQRTHSSSGKLAPSDQATGADDARLHIRRARATLPLGVWSHFRSYSPTTAPPEGNRRSCDHARTVPGRKEGDRSAKSGLTQHHSSPIFSFFTFPCPSVQESPSALSVS
jgi:hypothetical protein